MFNFPNIHLKDCYFCSVKLDSIELEPILLYFGLKNILLFLKHVCKTKKIWNGADFT